MTGMLSGHYLGSSTVENSPLQLAVNNQLVIFSKAVYYRFDFTVFLLLMSFDTIDAFSFSRRL